MLHSVWNPLRKKLEKAETFFEAIASFITPLKLWMLNGELGLA
ncbi:hypothetical protein [Okeania sp. SIO2G5]|nr:hypothetical protein [Okeania sp. SIO2G5]